MAAYERKHEMGDLEAYEEEVKKYLKDEDLCCEKSPVSYQIGSSQFPTPPDKEKKVSVDPAATVKQLAKEGDHLSWSPLALLPPPGKPKFISCSLPPISPALSPLRSSSGRRKSFKKWEGPNHAEQLRPVLRSLARQHSTKPSHDFTPQQGRMLLHRSKSCGEGRSSAPSVDEVDMIFSRRASMKLPETESGVRVLYDCTDDDDAAAGNQKDPEESAAPPVEENFKCGALCLFLPGFSKKKQVLQASLDIEEEDQGCVNVSRAVSVEKFECGSWSSAAILDADDGDDGAGRSYFDLPLELIRSSRTECDANSPVKTAFVFDRERKGVLKKKNTSTLAPRKSQEGSNRHVRFSTSTPTSHPTSPTSACSITPRLRKAREEFNAFLEAQST